MEAEQLWEHLHRLFDTDDGSLPEIAIKNLSGDGVIAIFSYLQRNCHDIADNASFWSIEDEQDKPIDCVANAAALVVQHRAEPFHFVCEELAYNGQVLPSIGVFVFDDQINLDYQMGQEWNAAKLKALFGILKDLKRIDVKAKVSIGRHAIPTIRKHFEITWERFLQSTEG